MHRKNLSHELKGLNKTKLNFIPLTVKINNETLETSNMK